MNTISLPLRHYFHRRHSFTPLWNERMANGEQRVNSLMSALITSSSVLFSHTFDQVPINSRTSTVRPSSALIMPACTAAKDARLLTPLISFSSPERIAWANKCSVLACVSRSMGGASRASQVSLALHFSLRAVQISSRSKCSEPSANCKRQSPLHEVLRPRALQSPEYQNNKPPSSSMSAFKPALF